MGEREPGANILDAPRTLLALRLHRVKHPEPVTNRELWDFLAVDKKTLISDRRAWESAGLLAVEEGHEGKVPFVRTRLTQEGLRVADLLLQQDAEVAKAARRKEREGR